MKALLILLLSCGLCNYCYAMGDVIEVDENGFPKLEKVIDAKTVKDTIHGEKDMIHIPVWITSNGNIYPEAVKGSVIGTLNIHNDGKPLVLVTNEGKPAVLVTNNGVPLITNNGPLLPDNKGKPYVLFSNDGKPLIAFDNQGKPLIEAHFDTGPLTKTADNAIYIIVTALVGVLILICVGGIYFFYWLFTRHNVTRKISKEI